MGVYQIQLNLPSNNSNFTLTYAAGYIEIKFMNNNFDDSFIEVFVIQIWKDKIFYYPQSECVDY